MARAFISLGDLILLQRGFDLPKRDRRNGDVPIIASTGIAGYHNEAKVKGPGVIIGRSGSIGGGQYTESDFWPLNTTLWVKDFKENYPKFVYYLLKSFDFERFNAGAGVPTLNRNHIANLKVPKFSPQEQKNIALILSAYDDQIDNNMRRIRLLEQSAHLLYKEWFVHLRFSGHEHIKLTNGIPEGWGEKRIADICKTVGGGTPSTKKLEYWGNEFKWVVPTDVTQNDCLVLLETKRSISLTGLKESSAKLVPANTILMTSRASVGFFALIDREVCTNQGFINIIPHQEEIRMYVLFNLMNRVNEIRSNTKGTTYPEISIGRFREMKIVIPSKIILMEFSNVAGDILDQIRCLKQINQRAASAHGLLLTRLMSGDITV